MFKYIGGAHPELGALAIKRQARTHAIKGNERAAHNALTLWSQLKIDSVKHARMVSDER